MRVHNKKIGTFITVSVLLLAGAVRLYGMQRISTKFSDIILAGMSPGMVYSVKQERDIPYTIINASDERAEIEVLIEKPRGHQIKEGYEPVPDISWVTVNPSKFTLEAGEEIDCDIIIAIPDEEEYAERHYQAMIVAQTAGKPGGEGVLISFALANRIRFSTGPRPETILNEYRQKVLSALEMEMMPMSLFIRESVPVGERIRFDGREYNAPQIVNRSREDYRLEFEMAKDPKNYGVSPEYKPLPEDAKVKLRTKKLKASARSIEDVMVDVTIPDKEEYRGQKYVFVISGQITDFDVPIEVFSRVYFTTED